MWRIAFMCMCIHIHQLQSFSILDLDRLKIKLSPSQCEGTLPLVALIHSAPQNVELRNVIRKTWGKSLKRIFVLGKHKEWNKKLKKENEKHQDILQVSFNDAYRNMTYKHLSGYWWMTKHCNDTKMVLRCDDDQVIDVHHLEIYVNHYIQDPHQAYYYLCNILQNEKPKRQPTNKWFVSFRDYPQDAYPDFCSGWAYVTNIPTMKSILKVSHGEPYFWINSLFVTGTLAKKLPHPISIYDWKNAFISEHDQYITEFLSGKMYTPELMVASNLDPERIEYVYKKFEKCHQKKCYQIIYDDPNLEAYIKPPVNVIMPPKQNPFSILDLDPLEIKLSPSQCEGTLPLVALIHSAPQNVELRKVIRKTWGKSLKSIFVLGEQKEWNKILKKENEMHQDILQVSFNDAYRNMTYKHLSGYWWMTEHCNDTKLVLRCDDDQVIDVHHLEIYVNHYIKDPHQAYFYLCYILQNEKPKRHPNNKWFVSFEDYPQDVYPDFCSGWAYVTNIPTMKSILKVSHDEPYFWIDDLFVTGTLTKKLSHPISIYNWHNAFLSEHDQFKTEFLSGNFYSPELMVGSDLDPKHIEYAYNKFENCHQKKCYQIMYDDPKLEAYCKPPVNVIMPQMQRQKTEL